TGNDALTGFTAPKILWVREHEPDVYARARLVLLPKDYVRLRLTGAAAMDKADGSGTLLFELAARDWSADVLAALDIPRAWLPPTYEGPEVTGTVTAAAAAETGLRAGAPVMAGGSGGRAARVRGARVPPVPVRRAHAPSGSPGAWCVRGVDRAPPAGAPHAVGAGGRRLQHAGLHGPVRAGGAGRGAPGAGGRRRREERALAPHRGQRARGRAGQRHQHGRRGLRRGADRRGRRGRLAGRARGLRGHRRRHRPRRSGSAVVAGLRRGLSSISRPLSRAEGRIRGARSGRRRRDRQVVLQSVRSYTSTRPGTRAVFQPVLFRSECRR